jgi:hypothetical protein
MGDGADGGLVGLPRRIYILSHRIVTAALAILSTALVARSQTAAPTTPSGPTSDVVRAYNNMKANLLKSADKMPAEDYTFRPTPEVRTFARVVNHTTEAQVHICGVLNGTDAAAQAKVPADTADKATIIAALQASFTECDKAYASLTAANALEMVTSGKTSRARIGYAWAVYAHDDEQYATLALYMRLKGLVPPSSEK